MIMKLILRFLWILLFPIRSAFAWDQHYLITRGALTVLPDIVKMTVSVTSFESLLAAMNFSTHQQFNESIIIHKAFRFSFKAGEKVGDSIPIIDVLSKYSDEPDWSMDQEIFIEGQYPKRWKKEYGMMGGKTGIASGAFRHMVWPEFSLAHPLATFKLPFSNFNKGMGEAPERAQLFIELSRKAKALGHTYWQARFIANAIHYLEDVNNPFHSTQTPTKKFIGMPFTNILYGSGFKNYVQAVTNIVSYYHWAFEQYIGRLMQETYETNSLGGKVFFDAIQKGSSLKPSSPLNIDALVIQTAKHSAVDAGKAARASIHFFPPITVKYDQFDPKKFMDDHWWEVVLRNGDPETNVRRTYFKTVEKMFEGMGKNIRWVVNSELALEN